MSFTYRQVTRILTNHVAVDFVEWLHHKFYERTLWFGYARGRLSSEFASVTLIIYVSPES